MSTVHLIAGLAWDPEIRGALAVLTGVVVLMGSVWLLLATNTGVRLASLLALSGLFAWMTIMGAFWWVRGIGYVGDAPSWQVVEIVEGDLGGAALDEATLLPTPYEIPSAYELAILSGDPAVIAEFGPVTRDNVDPELIAGLSEAEIDALVADLDAKHREATLSELAAVFPDVVDRAIADGLIDIDGWRLLSTAESGEAQAAALEFLAESEFAVDGGVKVLDAYDIGGKPGLPDDPSRWDRISTWVRNALRITHPPHYAVVQMQPALDQPVIPGQAPPRTRVDPSQPVISVVMVRDLGNLRLLPALVTIGSGLIFAALATMLHERDKLAMARLAESGLGG